LAVVSPFSFPIYASKIKESMMLEDPAAALERIYFEMYSRVEQLANKAEASSTPIRNRAPARARARKNPF
jgi:hypothetical protein